MIWTHDRDFLDDARFPEHRNPGVVLLPEGMAIRTQWQLALAPRSRFSVNGLAVREEAPRGPMWLARSGRNEVQFMKSKLLALAVAIGYAHCAAAQQQSPDCFPNHIKMDMCAQAAKIQATLAPNLPQKVSDNATLISIMAAGPLISMTLRWTFTKEKLEALLASSNMTLDQLVSQVSTFETKHVCGTPALAAFVRLGGSVGYLYTTLDGDTFASSQVTACPQ
jgi:hypothetical protein